MGGEEVSIGYNQIYKKRKKLKLISIILQYQRIFEEIKKRNETLNLKKRKRRQERSQRISKGTLTEKDKHDIQHWREKNKEYYYKLKAERDANQGQNKLKNSKKNKEESKKGIQDANSTALAQLFPSKPFMNQIRKPAKDSSE